MINIRLYFRSMDPGSFYEYAAQQWQHITWLELTAVLFSIIQVLLSYRNHIALYPAGIISSGLFTILMLQPSVGLYAEALLNSYYFIMSIYGWYMWYRKKENKTLPITRCSRTDWLMVLTICITSFGLLYFVLHHFTTSNVPFFDALVSATAWAGMWLLAKRKLENWILLNISNAVAIPLLFYKHLPLTALLTLFLFIVAVFGYFKWKSILAQQLEPTGTNQGEGESPIRYGAL